MSSRTLSALESKKSKTETKKSQNQLFFDYFDSSSTPFWTFLGLGADRARELTFQLYLQLWARRAQMTPVAGESFPILVGLSGVAPANQTKEWAKTKSSWISPIFVNSGVSLGKQARFTSNFGSSLPWRRSWTGLSLVWFAGVTPESCSINKRNLPKVFGASTLNEYVMHILLHKVTMGVKTLTCLPKIIGELFFGISGNDYLCHYLSEMFGEFLFGHFRQFEFLLPVSNSKIIWGAIFRYIGRLRPASLPLSCFVLFVALHECIMKA